MRRAFGWSFVNEVVGLGASAALFLGLTLVMEPAVYGVLGAILAVGQIVAPFAKAGTGWLMLRSISQGMAPDLALARAFGTVAVTSLISTAALVVLAPLLLGDIDRVAVGLILGSQLIFLTIAELAIHHSVCLADLRTAAESRIAGSVVRLSALLVVLLMDTVDIRSWGYVLAASTAASALVTTMVSTLRTSTAIGLRWTSFRRVLEGLPYAVGTSTEGFLAASDRPVLLRSGFAEEAGFYAAGYRIVTLGFVPLMAVIRAQDRRAVDAATASPDKGREVATDVIRQGLVASAAVGVVLFALGPVAIDTFLPASYGSTGDVVRALAWLPLIKAVQFPLGNLLSASGKQPRRVALTAGFALVNLAANLRYVPEHDWVAAAWSTMACEFGLSLGLGAACSRRMLRDRSLLSS